MAETISLNETLNGAMANGYISNSLPEAILNGLNPGMELRPYQHEALARFVYYAAYDQRHQHPAQLLFHMATGSGKTMIMAGCMLHLYELGYRDFIFFVNSTAIIEKTKDNFLNPTSSKYLFAPVINIDGRKIDIKQVDNFEAADPRAINIIFTTIQGLHTRLRQPRENGLTYEDFEERKIVLLSDEAHHINTDTKSAKLSKDEAEAAASWETTVTKIFSSHPDNYLLEFTATADLNNPEIKHKYLNKLIFDYPLKEFRKDGYSKEVKVLQADLEPFERALQAVLLSQYRRKVFAKYSLAVKPVILFKSKTIADSQAFYDRFTMGIQRLSAETLDHLRSANQSTVLAKMFSYLQTNDISLEDLIIELQGDFQETKCIVVDSKNDSYEKQLIINSLEDSDNEYRAIFAVDKLNEGWDVLNLFDIVRLYDTRDANTKAGKPGKTTMSEAQLIGRGARYCPFRVDADQPKFERKYDDDPDNELRICEELYYHASYDPRYISELNRALEDIGIKANDTAERVIRIERKTKPDVNEAEKDRVIFASDLHHRVYQYRLNTSRISESGIWSSPMIEESRTEKRQYQLISFGEPIIRKAMDRLPFYHFDSLKKQFPRLTSVSQFIRSDQFLAKVNVSVEGTADQLNNLSPDEKLSCTLSVLKEMTTAISARRA